LGISQAADSVIVTSLNAPLYMNLMIQSTTVKEESYKGSKST